MAAYIRCPECAFCIGKYTLFFDMAKLAYYNDTLFKKDSKFTNYDAEKIAFKPNITPSIEHIFNALGIANRCCRMHLITRTEFDKTHK
jgi:DNA-directed RNA polymerase subunit N (RpoN/RPB10)